METRRELAHDKWEAFLRSLIASPQLESVALDTERGRITGRWQGQPYAFRLPPTVVLPPSIPTVSELLGQLPQQPPNYLVILIQAGHSALAYFEAGELLHHKVIKKYMVRGNGKAQVGYLQTRGKSKAGSRVRLANSVSFFEDINEKLTAWEVADVAQLIFVSCGEKLRPLWFGSRIEPPFTKDDPRLVKVPYDVQRPDLAELQDIQRKLQRARWEGPAAPVDAFFASLGG